MKIIFTQLFTFVALVLGVSSANAQAFDLGNSSIEKVGHPNDASIDLSIDVTNISNTPFDVNVSRESFNFGNVEDNFCWGVYCYPPSVSESPNSVFMDEGETNTTFKGQFYPDGVEATYNVRYCFKPVGQPASNFCFDAKYITSFTSGFSEYELSLEKVSVGNVAPNPISGGIALFPVKLQNANNARIEILNALGQIVETASVSNNADAVAVDVSDLETGVYFYQLVTDTNKSAAKKMVIR